MLKVSKIVALLLLVVLAVTGLVGLSVSVYHHYEASRQPHWMSDLARQSDPKFAGMRSGFVQLTMQCFDPVKQALGQQAPTYAFVKFDVDLKTGQWRTIQWSGPPKGWVCPAVASMPGPAMPSGPNTPSTTPQK